MTTLARGHRVYFAAVGLLASWVGFWGYFVPARVDQAIPWLVPPLHARFLGAMYLSGAVFMLGCLFARRWIEVRAVVPLIAIWTGMLLVVSLFHLDAFDYSRTQVWIWFAAYLVYPLYALWLMWRDRGAPEERPEGAPLRPWVSGYLWLQGAALVLLALVLLLAPEAMVPRWPWKATPLLVQIYASPFLAYGVGSLLVARRRFWLEARVAVIGIATFAVLVLVASYLHRAAFDLSETPDRIWFGGFGVASLALLAIVAGHARRR
jgi:hypothetical protein